MATGTYGTVRPADVSPEDVEIILNFTPSRDETDNFVLTKLDSLSILRPYYNNDTTGVNNGIEILGGLYNLKLPAEQFNRIGIYTLFIRPVQIRTTITDCGVLSALPNVKGIVINLAGEACEERRFLHCAVATANDHNWFVAETRQGTVADCTGRDAHVLVLVFRRQSKIVGSRAGGNNDRVRMEDFTAERR